MADLPLGEDTQRATKLLQQMKEIQDSYSELNVKAEALKGGEKGAESAIIDTTSAMTKAIQATKTLSVETATLTKNLGLETEVLRGNTELWVLRAAAMRQATSATSGVMASMGAGAAQTTGASTGAVSVAETAALAKSVAPRVSAAVQAAAITEAAAPRARRASAAPEPVVSYQRPSAAPPETFYGYSRAAGSPAIPVSQRPTGARGEVDRYTTNFAGSRGAAGGEAGMSAATTEAKMEAAAAEKSSLALKQLAENEKLAGTEAERLAMQQKQVNLAYNQSVTSYANASTALSRNGALTTEFIQAFARGDVSLQEFGSQMTSTIGKFAGWAVAGAAVYGAYDALKMLGQGATQTQEGIQQLSRTIPGVASGGQRQQAEGTFRDLSQQLNVPISEVTSAMFQMSKVFHDVADAGKAAQAVLLASRLDTIAPAQSEQYFTAIAQSTHMTSGQPLIGVVNSLNALQNMFGARVSQTLPALARAAPIAQAGGFGLPGAKPGSAQSTLPQLEGLIGTLTTSGLTGTQAATALMRSAGTQLYRPQAQQIMRQYGIPAERGQYGATVASLEQHILHPLPGKEWTGKDLTTIANAMFGNQLGGRAGIPLLENIGRVGPMAEQAAKAAPSQSAMEELSKILGGVGEQFKKLGIELQGIGSELESAGILAPVQGLAQALGFLAQVVEKTVSPIQHIVAPFEALPAVLKDVLGAMLAVGALRMARNTNFGMATETLVGRISGQTTTNPRQLVKDTVASVRTYEVPPIERQYEAATARAMDAAAAVKMSTAKVSALTTPAAMREGTPEFDKRNAALDQQAEAITKAGAADTAEAEIAARLADRLGFVDALTNKRLSLNERMVLAEMDQYTSDQKLAVGLKALTTEAQKRYTLIASGQAPAPGVAPTGSTAGGAMAAAEGGAAAATVAAAAGAGGAASVTGQVQAMPLGVREGIIGQAEAIESPNAVPEVLAQAEQNTAATGTIAKLRAGVQARDVGAVGGALANSPMAMMMGGGMLSMIPGAVPSALGGALSTAGMGAMAASFGGESLAKMLGRMGGVSGTIGAEFLSSPLTGAGAALSVAGAATPGGAGLGESIAGGALLGAQIGTATDFITGPLGTLVGGVLGGVAGGLAHLAAGALGLGSSAPKGVSAGVTQRLQSLGVVQAQISGGKPSGQAYSVWSEQFGTLLGTAYGGDETTQDAQAASTAVQKAVQQAAHVVKAMGVITKTGQGSMKLLERAIGEAGLSAAMATDPYNTGQVIDQAWAGITAGIQSQLKYATTIAPNRAADLKAMHAAVAQENAAYAASITAPAGQAQQDITAMHALLTASAGGPSGASTTGLIPTLGPNGQVIAQTPAAIDAALQPKAAALAASAQQGLAALPARTAKYREAYVPNLAVLAQGSPAATTAARDAAAKSYQAQWTAFYNNEAKVAQSVASGGKPDMTAYNKAVQELAQLKDVGTQLGQLKAIDFATYADQFYQQAAAWAQATAQTAEAMAGGSVIGQLQAQMQGINASIAALNQSGLKQSNPMEYATTMATQVAAKETKRLQAAAQSAALAAVAPAKALSQIPSWQPVAQAAGQLKVDTATYDYMAAHSHDFDKTQIAAAFEKRQQDLLQVIQASHTQAQSIADANAQAQEANQSGNQLGAALTQVAAGYKDLALALGPAQQAQAAATIAAGNAAVRQANQDVITLAGQVAASATNITLKQDAINLATALKKYAQAVKGNYGPTVTGADLAAVGQARLQQFNDSFSQGVATIQFLQSTLQLSQQGALQAIQKMQKEKGLSVSEQQQLAAAAYAIETSQDNMSLFDLAPAGASVKTPTIYDVRSAAARQRSELRKRGAHDVGGLTGPSGSVQIGGATVNTTSGSLNTYDPKVEAALKTLSTQLTSLFGSSTGGSSTTNVHVAPASNTADKIGQIVHASVRSRLRSAGLRGT